MGDASYDDGVNRTDTRPGARRRWPLYITIGDGIVANPAMSGKIRTQTAVSGKFRRLLFI